jgi:hypothetical protein
MGVVRALRLLPKPQGIEPRRSQEGIPDRMGRAARMSWDQLFFDPIELRDGRVLRSLRDAGEFIQSLPKVTQDRPEWQVAVRALLLVVDCNGDPMLARIGMMRALNAGKPVKLEPRRKATKRYRVL